MLANYHQFEGRSASVGYLRNVLDYQGVTAPHTSQPFSEAMLMGINGGITAGYFVFEYQGYMPELNFLTLYPYNETPGAVFDRLCIPMHIQQTTDAKKAVANVLNALAKGKPAVVWADLASLPYFTFDRYDDIWVVMPIVVYGYDLTSGVVQIADRARVPLTASTEEMERARARVKKQRFKMMTIDSPEPDKLPDAVLDGIKACISLFHGEGAPGAPGAPGNFGFSGMRKWADALGATKGEKRWAKQFAPGERMIAGLTSAYYSTAIWSGGQGARGLYADFLDEAAAVLDNPALDESANLFRQSAALWQSLSDAFLPEQIAPFQQMKEFLEREAQSFLNEGNMSVEERKQIYQQMRDLKAQVAADFPLSETEAAQMSIELRDRIMAMHDAERVAVQTLTDAL